MERLAPAVLLVLFDGVPAVVHIEEPRQGIQFGVRLDAGRRAQRLQAEVIARDAQRPAADVAAKTLVAVPFRPGAPGVLDLKQPQRRRSCAPPATNMGGRSVDGAEFALQMLRFPYRQVFGDPSHPGGSAARLRPTCFRRDRQSVAQLTTASQEVLAMSPLRSREP